MLGVFPWNILSYHETCYVMLPWNMLSYVNMTNVNLPCNRLCYHETKMLLSKYAILDVAESNYMFFVGSVSYMSLAWRSISVRNIATFCGNYLYASPHHGRSSVDMCFVCSTTELNKRLMEKFGLFVCVHLHLPSNVYVRNILFKMLIRRKDFRH